jgi:hypothetical protein
VPAATAHLTHDHRAGVNADTQRQLDTVIGLQTRIERRHGLRNTQPGIDGPLRIVFMGHGITKIDEQAVTEVLGNVPLVAVDDLGRGFLIGPYDLAQVFRIEFAREVGGAHQVTEHHRQLAAFGFGGSVGGRLGNRLVWRSVCGDGLCGTCWPMRWRRGLGNGWRQGRGRGRRDDCGGVCGGRGAWDVHHRRRNR